jgi:bifunctional UDP-N-acetylglucosamine pyrophosphorylase / glucosamine-1-phosphate N-acetyltransferase
MKSNRQIIILAAGKGTRMGTPIAKVLINVLGRPMIEYPLNVALKIVKKPIMVVGFQSDTVKEIVGKRAQYVLQSEQRGTGHAVSCTKNLLDGFVGNVAIVYGDAPMISAETLQKLFASQEKDSSVLTIATTVLPDFHDWKSGFWGFGRIVRDATGGILSIRELKDCTDEEKQVLEVNPGYYCFDSQWLWENIEKLNADNNQNEYYLTDLIEIAVKGKERLADVRISPKECLGINTVEQLQIVEDILGKN